MAKVVGHTFLARLGKKRLRPGGLKATNWLLKQTSLNQKTILEVACNRGTTALRLAKKYQCQLIAIDQDQPALNEAITQAAKTKLITKPQFLVGNALDLSFEDHHFDVVLNEAMLTMFSDQKKQTAIGEYYRVLKNNGVLLTHDICFFTRDERIQKEIIAAMSQAINIAVVPKEIDEWQTLFAQAGFRKTVVKTGKMTLLNPWGMIRDEGLINTLRIIKNAHKPANKEQFKQMRQVFKKYARELGFIAVASYK